MEFVILKIILLLAILIAPNFFNPGKMKRRPGKKPKEENGLSDYSVNENGYLEEIKKDKGVK